MKKDGFMNSTDEVNLKQSLEKASRACKIIRVILAIVAAIAAVGLAAAISVLGFQCVNLGGGFALLLYTIVYGVLILTFLYMMICMFSDIVKGGKPFSVRQARRLQIIALVALLFVVLELIFSYGMAYEVIPSAGIDILINNGASEPTVNLNIGMLVFSGIMYSLSAIFRYAALLQQLSDDTV